MEANRARSFGKALRAALAVLTAVAPLAVNVAASPLPTGTNLSHDAEDCLEAVPEEASIAGVTDTGRRVALDVHVLLDGVSVERGMEVMARAADAYDELRIDLRTTFQQVDIPAQKMAQEFPTAEPEPSSDSSYLLERAKRAVGGERPRNVDVVYLMTSDRVTGGTAGQADCIGGVRYPNRAFAIGQEEPDAVGTEDSIWLCCTWTTAKIAAHEIAHLLGAHHHYSNCVEGAPESVEDRHIPTCSLMMTDVGLINLRMSTLEAAVVRGHAVAFANRPFEGPPSDDPEPKPDEDPDKDEDPKGNGKPNGNGNGKPEPDPEPTPQPSPSSTSEPTPSPSPEPTPEPEPITYARVVTLRLDRHLRARGHVDAGSADMCSDGVLVVVQRATRRGWVTMKWTSTAADGGYRIRLADRPGRYRAVVDETSGSDHVCSAAASIVRRHRH